MLSCQLCLTICNPMDCSPPGSYVHGVSQARMLEWVAISYSRGSSWPGDQTWLSCITGRFFTIWATREANRDYLLLLFSQVYQFRSVQFSHSVVSDSATPWIAACQASLSITNSQSSPRLTSIESVMPSSHLILCCPLLLLPPIPPSISVFSNESTLCMRWPKYWSFSFSIIPSKEIPGLISFRMDWLDLLAVQGTLKSLHLLGFKIAQLEFYHLHLLPQHTYWDNKGIRLSRRNIFLLRKWNMSSSKYIVVI